MSRRMLIPSNWLTRQADPLPPLYPEPNEGDHYYNSYTKKLRVFRAGQWEDVSSGFEELDVRYINTSGDTMTGTLTLKGNASSALDAVPKQQLDSAIAAIPPPVNEVAIATTQPSDTNVELWVDPNGTWATEFATKAYVDGSGWIALPFQNGWGEYGGGFAPSGYQKVGRVVYLRGLVASGTMGAAIATLPAGYRPATTLLTVVQSNGIGRMDITAAGALMATSGSNGWFSIVTSFIADQ